MKGRRDADEAGSDLGRTAVLAVLIAALLTSGVAMVAAATTIEIGPKVGDILVFRPGATMPQDWEFTVAHATAPGTCSLRPDVMARVGGSLIVEQRDRKLRMFRVHWAGAHTGDGPTDCGASADLEVPGVDLQLLSNAVGGAGVEKKTFGWF